MDATQIETKKIEVHTKITFKLLSDTQIAIMRDGNSIGMIWSEKKDGTLPYPHEQYEHVANSIQLCGFDSMSEMWGCGVIHGKKDVVIKFIPLSEWTEGTILKYQNYVKEMIAKAQTGELQNFHDWRVQNPF